MLLAATGKIMHGAPSPECRQKRAGSQVAGRRVGSPLGEGSGQTFFEFSSKNAGFYALHFHCEKLLVARNRDREGAGSTPWGTKDVKRTGIENLTGVSTPQSPVNSHAVVTVTHGNTTACVCGCIQGWLRWCSPSGRAVLPAETGTAPRSKVEWLCICP